MSYATKEQLESLMADIASKVHIPTVGIGGGYAPIGTIISYMGTTAPQDYLICDGSVYNIADYSQLANFIEAQFGSKDYFGGNGTTTFGVPDLRGEFLRGTGTNSHINSGDGGAVGEHQHPTLLPGLVTFAGTKYSNGRIQVNRDVNINTSEDGDQTYNYVDSKTTRVSLVRTTDESSKGTTTKTSISTGNGRVTVRPTNTSVLYCIKAVVAGEVYSTDERVVGTWIDGKPIYQKTIDFGALPNATTKNVSHNITNLDEVVGIAGFAYDGTATLSLPYVVTSSSTVNNQINILVNDTYVRIGTGADRRNAIAYVTIRYTKTTD